MGKIYTMQGEMCPSSLSFSCVLMYILEVVNFSNQLKGFLNITLSISITMVCGTDIILRNSPSFSLNDDIFHILLSVLHNIVMDLNNELKDAY